MNLLDILQGIAVMVTGLTAAWQLRAVPGSYPYYVATSWAIASEVVTAAISSVQVGQSISHGNAAKAGLEAFFVLLYTAFAYWDITHHDNWFNSQWKRSKRQLKEMRKRLLQNLLPSPLA